MTLNDKQLSTLRHGWLILTASLLLSVSVLGSVHVVGAQDPYQAAILEVNTSGFPQMEALVSVIDDQGMSVTDLGPANIEVFEDERQVEEVTIDTHQVGLQIVFVIDASTSIKYRGATGQRRLQEVKDALKAFANDYMGDGQNWVTIIEPKEGDIATVLEFTGFKNALLNAIEDYDPTPQGNTPLYELLLEALTIQETQNPSGRSMHKAVVVFSDGVDIVSEAEVADVNFRTNQEHISIHTVLLGSESTGPRENMQKLAERSLGSYTHYSSLEHVRQNLFNRLIGRCDHYTLSFNSTINNSGLHSLRVVVGDTAEAKESFDITVEPPSITITQPTSGKTIKRSSDTPGAAVEETKPTTVPLAHTITWTDAHTRTVNKIELAVNNGAWQEIAQEGWDISDLDTGSYSLQLRATGELGLRGESEPVNVTIQVDIPPVPPTQTPPPTGTPSTVKKAGEVLSEQWLAILALGMAFITLLIVYRRPPVIAQVGQKIKEKTEMLFGEDQYDDSQADAHLQVISGDKEGRTLPLHPGDTRLGRDEEFSTLVFADKSVSKLHAVISYDTDGCWIRDEGSVNGTWVNGERIEMDRRKLHHDDKIKLGRVTLRFVSAAEAPKNKTEPMIPIESSPETPKDDTESIDQDV